MAEGDAFRPSLEQRAALALAGNDTGVRRVSWAELDELDTESIVAFQDALSAEAERRHLTLEVFKVTSTATGFEGIEVRWRPAPRMTL